MVNELMFYFTLMGNIAQHKNTDTNSKDNGEPILGASSAVFCGSHILLIKRGKPPRLGQWSLPGGHVNPNEPPIDAAQRELQEETALIFKDLSFDQLVKIENKGKQYHISLFTGEAPTRPTNLIAGDDASDIGWFNALELEALYMADDTKRLVQTLFKKRSAE